MCGILVVILAVCLIYGIRTLHDYSASEEIYDRTNEEYVTGAEEQGVSEPEWYQQISVDLEGIQTKNPEIVGWIYFENDPEISYPVLQASDNSKYLKTAWQGDTAVAGSIFLESGNASDFSDYHTIIYGHNMRNLTMFGRLRYYRNDSEYLTEHEFFQIITNDMYYRYRIVSCKDVSVKARIYRIWMKGGEEFRQFVEDSVLADSMVDTDFSPGPEDHIVTLSTCNNSSSRRFTVSAVRAGEAARRPAE